MPKPTLRDLFRSQEAYERRNEPIDFSKFEREAADAARVRKKLEQSAQINISELRTIHFNLRPWY